MQWHGAESETKYTSDFRQDSSEDFNIEVNEELKAMHLEVIDLISVFQHVPPTSPPGEGGGTC